MPTKFYKPSTPHYPSEKFVRGAARFLFREKNYDSARTNYGYQNKIEHPQCVGDIIDFNYNCIYGWQNMGATKSGYMLKSDGYSYSLESTLWETVTLPKIGGYELAVCTQNVNGTIDTLYTVAFTSKVYSNYNNVTTQSNWQCEFELGMLINFKGEMP